MLRDSCPGAALPPDSITNPQPAPMEQPIVFHVRHRLPPCPACQLAHSGTRPVIAKRHPYRLPLPASGCQPLQARAGLWHGADMPEDRRPWAEFRWSARPRRRGPAADRPPRLQESGMGSPRAADSLAPVCPHGMIQGCGIPSLPALLVRNYSSPRWWPAFCLL